MDRTKTSASACCSTRNHRLPSLSLTFLEEGRAEGEELQEEAFETKTQQVAKGGWDDPSVGVPAAASM